MENIDYILAKVSVNIIIKKGNDVIMVQQARPERVYGKWSLPGGKVNIGESFEGAVRREILEETGLTVTDTKHLGIIHDAPDTTIKHVFIAEVKDGDFKYDKEELLDVKRCNIQEVFDDKMPLRGEWVKQAIDMIPKK